MTSIMTEGLLGNYVRRIGMRKIVSLVAQAAALCATLVVIGCAGDKGELNRVQPGYVKKVDLLNTAWYYRRTVVDAPETMGEYASFGGGDIYILERVRFDIQEDYLFAYRDYEYTPNGNGYADPTAKNGQPIAAFPITDHFDIVYDYNAATGEKSNIRDENSTDRPWYEREYMRVAWEKDATLDNGYNWFVMPVKLLDVNGNGVHYVYEDDAVNPFHARMNPADGYMDFVVNHLVMADPETCYYVYDFQGNPMVCGSGEIRVRHAFMRVDADREAGYQPLWYPDSVVVKDDQGRDVPDPVTGEVMRQGVFDRFGYFRLDRLTYNNYRELTESGRLYRAFRFDIWDRSVDKDGNVIPYASRQPRPIEYYLNAEFPDKLLDTAQEVAAGWNDVFKNTVASLQGKPASAVPDMYLIHRNSCNADNIKDYLAKHKDVSKAAATSMGEQPDDTSIKAHLMNWCSAAEYHSRDLKDRFVWQQVGDPRYNMLYWVANPLQVGWGGYGPMFGDPMSGRIIVSSAYILGWNIEGAATKLEQYIQYINGDLTTEQVLAGSDVPFDPDLFTPKALADRLDSVENAPLRALKQPSDTFMQSLDARMSQLGTGADELLKPLDNSNYYQDRLDSVAGTSLESDWLTRPEDLLLAGKGTWTPDQPVTLDLLKAASFGTRKDTMVEKQKLVERYFEERTWDPIAVELDPVLAGLAKQLKGMPRETARDYLVKTLFKAVSLHELGHNLGLRHNFEGSYDALNYPKKFWDIETQFGSSGTQGAQLAGQEPTAAQLAVEQQKNDARQPEYRYSSIMDYHGKINADFGGLAPYDYAAVKFGYGQIIEQFADASVDTKELRTWQHLNNYRDLPAQLGGVQGMYNRKDVIFDWTSPSMTKSRVDLLTKNEVPYMFCIDEWNGITPTCKTFDYGASQAEVEMAHRISYQNYTIFANFLRNRLVLNQSAVMNRGYSVFSENLMTYQYWYYWRATDPASCQANPPGKDCFRGSFLEKDMVAAFTDGFNLLAETLTAPEPGKYVKCTENVSQPPAKQRTVYFPYEYDEFNPTLSEHAGKDIWQAMYIDEECDPPDDYNPNGPLDKVIPVGQAQPNFLGISDEFIAWTFSYIGTYWDKESALITLVNPRAYIPRVNGQEDRRTFSISPYRTFEREILSLLSKIIRYDLPQLSYGFDEVVDAKTLRPVNALEPAKIFDTGRPLDETGSVLAGTDWTYPGNSSSVLFPAIARNLQRYAILYGEAFLNSPLDGKLDFGTHMRVVVKDAVDDFTVDPAQPWKTCTMPDSGLTYKAWQTSDSFSIAYSMVADCADWVAKLQNEEAALLVARNNLLAAGQPVPADPAYHMLELAVAYEEHMVKRYQNEVSKVQQTLQYARLMSLQFQHGVEL
jgi:hypothetical protein